MTITERLDQIAAALSAVQYGERHHHECAAALETLTAAREQVANRQDWIKAAHGHAWAHDRTCPRHDADVPCNCGLDSFLCRPRPVVEGFRDEVAALKERIAALTTERDAAVAANKAEFDGHNLTIADHRKEINAIGEQLEFDRSAVAVCLSAANRAIDGRHWLTEGRGSYEWNDDRWHEEFRAAAMEIKGALAPLTKIAANWKDCPQTGEDVARARLNLQERIATLESEAAEHDQSFELRWKADERAIKRWQDATGKTQVWPDHADLCVWLMEQVAALEASREAPPKNADWEALIRLAYLDGGESVLRINRVEGEYNRMRRQIPDLTKERDKALSSKKHTQDWYGSRWQRMHDWFRSPEMKGTKAARDWFSIAANGGLLEGEPPVSFMAEVNMDRYALQQAQKQIATSRTTGCWCDEHGNPCRGCEWRQEVAVIAKERNAAQRRIAALEAALREIANDDESFGGKLKRIARAALSPAAPEPPHRVLCWKCKTATRSDSDHCQYCGVLTIEVDPETGATAPPPDADNHPDAASPDRGHDSEAVRSFLAKMDAMDPERRQSFVVRFNALTGEEAGEMARKVRDTHPEDCAQHFGGACDC